MAKQIIKIATRKSILAIWQANFIKRSLEQIHSNLTVELVPLVTEGDRLLGSSLAKIGGKGLFIKELEKAMLEQRADIAVHSVKDLPVAFLDEFCIAAICERSTPYDALVSKDHDNVSSLPTKAVIGTSSLRRQSQLKALRPDLQVKNLRGNLDTRLKKLDAGEFDAIILAATGLERLEKMDRISCLFTPEDMLPAVGQGAIGVECLRNRKDLCELVKELDHETTRQCILAERAVSFYLGGSCQLPIAAFAEIQEGKIQLRALIGKLDGSEIIRCEKTGPTHDPDTLGRLVAEELLTQGADEILKELT